MAPKRIRHSGRLGARANSSSISSWLFLPWAGHADLAQLAWRVLADWIGAVLHGELVWFGTVLLSSFWLAGFARFS